MRHRPSGLVVLAVVLAIVAVSEGIALARAHSEQAVAEGQRDSATSRIALLSSELADAKTQGTSSTVACAQVADEYLHEAEALKVLSVELFTHSHVPEFHGTTLGRSLTFAASSVQMPFRVDFHTYARLGLGDLDQPKLKHWIKQCGLAKQGSFDTVHPAFLVVP